MLNGNTLLGKTFAQGFGNALVVLGPILIGTVMFSQFTIVRNPQFHEWLG